MRSHLLLSCEARSSLRFTFSPYSRSRRFRGSLSERSCSFMSKSRSTQQCHAMPVAREGRKDVRTLFPFLRSLTLQLTEERKWSRQCAPGSHLKLEDEQPRMIQSNVHQHPHQTTCSSAQPLRTDTRGWEEFEEKRSVLHSSQLQPASTGGTGHHR